jgi:tetratricopeptide (TPR) repeat protein
VTLTFKKPGTSADPLQEAHRCLVQRLGKDRQEFTHDTELPDCLRKLEIPTRERFNVQPALAALPETFVGRERWMENLWRTSLKGRRADRTYGAIAIHAPPGFGKSRVLAEYFRQHGADNYDRFYCLVPEAGRFQEQIANLCSAMKITRAGNDTASRFKAVSEWFSRHSDWLLLLDGVDNEETGKAIHSCLADWNRGQVILAGRYNGWSSSLVKTVPLKPLTINDATDYLVEQVAGSLSADKKDRSDARKLALRLQGLCLALRQVAAWIKNQHESFAKALEVLDEDPEWITGYGADGYINDAHWEPIARVFALSLRPLREDALKLLWAASEFASDPIPRVLMEEHRKMKVGKVVAQASQPAAPVRHQIESARDELVRCSLLEWTSDEKALVLHPYLQEIARQWARRTESGNSRQRAIDLILDASPPGQDAQDPKGWRFWNAVQPHVERLAESGRELRSHTANDVRLLNHLGMLLYEQSRFAKAREVHEQALELGGECWQDEAHSERGKSANQLALTLDTLDGAKPRQRIKQLYRQAISMFEKAGDNQGLGYALGNLGSVLDDEKCWAEAEHLQRKAMEVAEKALKAHAPGSDTPQREANLAETHNLLAWTLFNQATHNDSKLDEAAHHAQEAIRLYDQHPEDNDGWRAVPRYCLAEILVRKREFVEARKFAEEGLKLTLKHYPGVPDQTTSYYRTLTHFYLGLADRPKAHQSVIKLLSAHAYAWLENDQNDSSIKDSLETAARVVREMKVDPEKLKAAVSKELTDLVKKHKRTLSRKMGDKFCAWLEQCGKEGFSFVSPAQSPAG